MEHHFATSRGLRWLAIGFLVVILAAVVSEAKAQQRVDPKYDRIACWNWGGSGSAGQGQYLSCPTTVVTVVETKVERVQIPGPPVPGPVRIERVEVPAAVKAPEKKVRE